MMSEIIVVSQEMKKLVFTTVDFNSL